MVADGAPMSGPQAPCRVVHVIVGLGVGGAELMLRRLVRAQRQAAPDVSSTVVSLTTLGPVGQQLQADGVEVLTLGMQSPWQMPLVLWRLTRCLRQRRPDLVQTWMVHADLLGGLAARWAGVRSVVWGIRTTDFSLTPPATRLVRWVCARLSTRVPHTIVCAAEASRRAHVRAGYDAGRMVVIPNGFDLAALQPDAARGRQVRREWGVADDELLVGSVGRFNRAKDQANFIAAAGRVAARHARCRFVLVGRGNTADNATLQQWSKAAGLADRLLLVGERADVPACLAAMDLFVLPSRSEGFPNVLGEAMAMARPCVSTDAGDAAWMLGEAGRVVPVGDPQALADAVDAVLCLTADERHALGQQARVRLVAEFSMERACERFTALQLGVVADVAHSQGRIRPCVD